MGEVRCLRGNYLPLPKDEADPNVVAAIERLLARAKAGQIKAIAWCTYKANEEVTAGWSLGAHCFEIGAGILKLSADYGRELQRFEMDV